MTPIKKLKRLFLTALILTALLLATNYSLTVTHERIHEETFKIYNCDIHEISYNIFKQPHVSAFCPEDTDPNLKFLLSLNDIIGYYIITLINLFMTYLIIKNM